MVAIVVPLIGGDVPRDQGSSADFLNLPPGISLSTIGLAAVFGFLSFAGFESAGSFGEEAHRPRRTIPYSLWAAIAFGGVFYCGLHDHPDTRLRHRRRGRQGVRVLAGAARRPRAELHGQRHGRRAEPRRRDQLLRRGHGLCGGRRPHALCAGPRRRAAGDLGKVRRSNGTPAIALAFVLALDLVGLSIFAIAGTPAIKVFFYFATFGTLSLLVMYIATNLAAARFLTRGSRPWEALIPLVGIAVAGYVLYHNIYPVPEPPFDLFPYLVGAWLLIGLLLIAFLPGLRDRAAAGMIAAEAAAVAAKSRSWPTPPHLRERSCGRTAWTRNLAAPVRAVPAHGDQQRARPARCDGRRAGLGERRRRGLCLDLVHGAQRPRRRAWRDRDLRHWVNDGLMVVFFFVVGLEARREFDLGELRERRRITLPLFAAIGGMALPVLIYLAINAGNGDTSGWGAAMSTDTAFALGALALVGPRRGAAAARLHPVARRRRRPRGADRHRASSTASTSTRAPWRSPPRCSRRCWRRRAGSNVGRPPLYVIGAAMWVALLRLRRASSRRRPRGRALDSRLPGGARRARARHEPRPAVPRAADGGTGPQRARGRRVGGVAQRAPAAGAAPLDELLRRAAVRARQCRDPAERRRAVARGALAGDARDPRGLRDRQARGHPRARPG